MSEAKQKRTLIAKGKPSQQAYRSVTTAVSILGHAGSFLEHFQLTFLFQQV